MKKLDRVYEQKDLLVVTREKLHEYLSIILDFRNKDRYAFSQYDAIKKFWLSLPPDLHRPYHKTPAPKNLIKVNKDAKRLDNVKKD